ncbi:hypothetical protein JIN85_14320 [Luteolibacter pohnpeiensis]|uniref:Uncharacterized protein n=1 Tax=Luteolibacter pohnpeiensis TaxID=454153 RepID=A0A934VXK4_9BACT|nr:hypothetical protein [Luteolibacter pohnpeiensis]MBK1883594.1 hypothetical protein [Luteolibacter pohnpeiensis]
MKTLKTFAKPVSWSSLSLIVIPPILFYSGGISQAVMCQLMILGTIIWFISAPLWMRSE